jgi:hypothetical protein
MEFAAGAVQLRQMFDAYVSAGFSEEQAMRLLIAVMTSAMGARR